MPSPPRLAATTPRPAASRSWLLTSTVALAVALASTLSAAPAGATKAKAPVAKVTIGKVTVTSTATDPKLTIAGRVALPAKAAKERKRTVVSLTLVGYAGTQKKTESFSAKLSSKDTFSVTHTTKLSGALGLVALVKIAGKPSGRQAVKTITVARAGAPTPSSAGAGAGIPGAGSPGPPTQGTSSNGILNGTFQIEAGVQHPDGSITGSWFEMLDPGNAPLLNGSSAFPNQDFTPLSPGTDGGLQSFEYQGPPSPAYEGSGVSGNALANRIVKPVAFFGIDFSIVTATPDIQSGESISYGGSPVPLADPLPQIVDTGGVLSGQTTAWTAQWNGLSFNQGSPKPQPLPGDTSTQPVTGTYDPTTKRYVLTWHSFIVSGPFNGFTGSWHLEGTFLPAG